MTTHRVPAGAMADGLLSMTDAEWHSKVDTSPSISDAYRAIGRVRGSTHSACAYSRVFGIRSRIGGVNKGDAPAVSERLKR